ncbi:MAG: ECF transporter S component [Ruminococcaceae bacterium]|nr:ECF transporter S component [Oscillospiraceae bacterium]
MKQRIRIRHMVLSALFLALAYVMPFLTGQIPEIGSMLCPMHIPVLLCGFVCGWPWGAAVGFAAPLLRSMLTGGFPPMFPTAVCMAFELCAYGALAGACYRLLPRKKPFVYAALLIAMLGGRLVWGGAMLICTGVSGSAFGLAAFAAGAFTNALPGIVLQIVLVPLLVMLIERISRSKNEKGR